MVLEYYLVLGSARGAVWFAVSSGPSTWVGFAVFSEATKTALGPHLRYSSLSLS